jgi:hypothetical protein
VGKALMSAWAPRQQGEWPGIAARMGAAPAGGVVGAVAGSWRSGGKLARWRGAAWGLMAVVIISPRMERLRPGSWLILPALRSAQLAVLTSGFYFYSLLLPRRSPKFLTLRRKRHSNVLDPAPGVDVMAKGPQSGVGV